MGSHRLRPGGLRRRPLLLSARMRGSGRTLVVAQGLTGYSKRR